MKINALRKISSIIILNLIYGILIIYTFQITLNAQTENSQTNIANLSTVRNNSNREASNKQIFNSTIYKSEGKNSFSYGFKAGIGLWRMTQLKGTYTIASQPEYSYPPGFSLGMFMENKLIEHILIVDELIFQNSNTMITVYPGDGKNLEQKVTMQALVFSILLKYQASWLWDTYFLLGPSFGYLVNAEYNSYDEIYLDRDKADITKNFPAFNTAIEFGLGEKYEIFGSNILIELKAQKGYTKYEYKAIEGRNIGEWKNSGLVLLIGLQL